MRGRPWRWAISAMPAISTTPPPVEALEGVPELVDRAAIEPARGDEFLAGAHQGLEDDELGGMARGDGERRGAAFERRHALLQNRLGRVHDARIDIAELLEPEQRSGMVDAVEDEGRRLVDRRRPRARCRIRLGAGMDRQGLEIRSAHLMGLLPLSGKEFGLAGFLLRATALPCVPMARRGWVNPFSGRHTQSNSSHSARSAK